MTRILKSSWLLSRLSQSTSEVLYIDEFSFDVRKVNYFGWGPKNRKLYIAKMPEWFTISFIVGLSAQRYYGVIGKVGAINSIVVSQYIKDWMNQFNSTNEESSNNLVIVADNATIHKSKLVKDTIRELKVGIVTIVPYWPFLNPIESYISVIKSKIKKNQKSYLTKTFKPISLKLLQNSFDDCSKIEPDKFIKHSKIETWYAISALTWNKKT